MDVGEQDCFGYSALHLAVMKDDEVMVRTLLEWGADVGVEEDAAWRGETPASIAAEARDHLVATGERDWRDREGVPLLHLAVKFAHTTPTEDLLDTLGERGTANARVRGRDGPWRSAGRPAWPMSMSEIAMDVLRFMWRTMRGMVLWPSFY